MEGWIKLDRKILEWEWYKNMKVKTLFLHLLLTANISDKRWQGIEIKRGQLFCSVQNLSKELKLTSKEIRNCFDKLQNSGEIGIKGASNGTMITIYKYDTYQCNGQATGQTKGKQRANEGQQLKKDKEGKELYSEQILKFIEWLKINAPRVLEMQIQISDENLTKLKDKFTALEIQDILKAMHNYKPLLQKNVDAYLTVTNWINREHKKAKENKI